MLRGAAERIAAHVRAGDLAARYGGDEFVVVCVDLHSGAEARLTAARLRHELAQRYRVNGADEHIGASVGVALWRAPMTAAELLREADQAMYAAKQRVITVPEPRVSLDRPADADLGEPVRTMSRVVSPGTDLAGTAGLPRSPGCLADTLGFRYRCGGHTRCAQETSRHGRSTDR